MKKRQYRDYLIDIQTSSVDVADFISGMTYRQFLRDRKTSNAVIRSLEVIGEAVKHVPAEVRKRYPEVPWREMAGMRNKVIHEYFGVDYKIVWKTAKKSLPKLKTQFEEIWRQETERHSSKPASRQANKQHSP